MKKTLSIILVAIMLLSTLPLSVFADNTVISTVDLTYNEAAATFNTAYTEGECDDTICNNIDTATVGTKIDSGDSGLFIRNAEDNDWWGIGNGANQVNAEKKYAIRYCLDVKDGYDWPESMKADENLHSLADYPEFTLYFNGEKMTDIEFKYNTRWKNIKFYIPIGSPSTEPCIKSVNITENEVSVAKGDSYQFEAETEGTADNKNIVWEIIGAQSLDTVINNGLLVIADDETAETVTVKASSEYDENKFDEAVVTVLAETPTIELSVSEESISVYKGSNCYAMITVSGTQTNRKLSYTLTGATSDKTRLNDGEDRYDYNNGSVAVYKYVLVGSDETAEKLTLTATSEADNTKSVSVVIQVKDTERVSRIDLKYDKNVAKFKVTDTEGYAKNTIAGTVSVEADYLIINNFYLMYKLEDWNGIGDGSSLLDKNKNYALEYYIELKGSQHDWPEVLKADEKSHTVSEIEGFEVYVNGEKRTDIEYKYNSSWNGIFFYIPTEILFNGWEKADGKWNYYVKGKKVTSWKKIGGKWYYFDSNGVMLTGWQKILNKWYYFNSSGAMLTDWQKISKKWYYFNSSGVMLTGWQKISKKWYYFNSSGAMLTGWQKISGKWYYFESSGAMKTGWLKSGGKWYYLDSSGAMVSNCSKKIGSKTYKFDKNGVCTNP